MSSDSEKGAKPKGFDPPYAEIKARQMGELQRGDQHWEVVLEAARDQEVGVIRGRIRFVSGAEHRLSGWIFLEWSDKEIEDRFTDFSAQELWNLLDSINT